MSSVEIVEIVQIIDDILKVKNDVVIKYEVNDKDIKISISVKKSNIYMFTVQSNGKIICNDVKIQKWSEMSLKDFMIKIIALAEDDDLTKYLHECIPTSKSVLAYLKKLNCAVISNVPHVIIYEYRDAWKHRNDMNFEIELINNNIYSWNIKMKFDNVEIKQMKEKFGYDYVSFNIYFHDVYFPYYPPQVEVIRPIFKDLLNYRISQMKIFKQEYWSPAWDITKIISKIRKVIKKYGKIDMDNIFNSCHVSQTIATIENMINSISSFSTNLHTEEIDDDEQMTNWFQQSTDSQGKKIIDTGIGYTKSGEASWDITVYVDVMKTKQAELCSTLGKIINEMDTNSDEIIEYIKQSHLMSFIIQQISFCSIINLIENEELYDKYFKLILLFGNYCNWPESLGELFVKLKTGLEKMIELEKAEKTNSFIKKIIDILENQILIHYKKIIETSATLMEVDKQKDDKNDYVTQMEEYKFAICDFAPSEKKAKIEQGDWSKAIKRITSEIILVQDIPLHQDSCIFIRVDEKYNMAMQFMITGPVGTPYEYGCYVFNVLFPSDYPQHPPAVSFISNGGKRLNPNLYDNGHICLSILGTYSGPQRATSEQWNSETSTIMQIILSIQSQILTFEPWFNEPGRDSYRDTDDGRKQNDNYVNSIRPYILKHAILDFLVTPEKYPEFADAIKLHFKLKKNDIIAMLEKIDDASELNKLKKEIISELSKLT